MVNSSSSMGLGSHLPGDGAQLSSLMDGELDASAVAAVVAAWRDDPQTRTTWHAYHLVGDVLRSDELALSPVRDRAFIAALRTRLAAEPVPLAPAPLSDEPAGAVKAAQSLEAPVVAPVARPRLRHRLLAPAAVAAGFVAVAGVLVVFRIGQPGGGSELPRMAAAPAPASVVPVSGLNVVRDARLDRYLSAHRKLANGFDAPGSAGQQVQIVYEAR